MRAVAALRSDGVARAIARASCSAAATMSSVGSTWLTGTGQLGQSGSTVML
jgi:hypothetical protein